MNAFAQAFGDIFADPNFGSPAVYTPPGGGTAVPCSVVLKAEDREINIGEGRPFAHGTVLEVRTSEVSPLRNGTFVIGLDTLTVQDDPRRLDPDKLVWTCTVR